MCGIAGYWSRDQLSKNCIREMTESLVTRGPDNEGVWIEEESGVAFGHRRLAVIELSEAGNQPMISSCDRYVITYNGEIYNHLALRNELSRQFGVIKWRGQSDTETLLMGITLLGVKKCLSRLNGMFAFALWDRREKKLF